MTIFSLSKMGYGSIKDLNDMDTPDLFDLIEFHKISNAIESHMIEQSKNGSH